MRRFITLILVLVVIVAGAGVGSVDAGGRGGGGRGGWHGGHGHGHFHGGRVFVGVGPFWGPYWGWGGYPYYPYWYPPYPATPSVVVQEPPVYIQQAPAGAGMWYYCQPARGYYPSVPSCPEAWIQVPAHN